MNPLKKQQMYFSDCICLGFINQYVDFVCVNTMQSAFISYKSIKTENPV